MIEYKMMEGQSAAFDGETLVGVCQFKDEGKTRVIDHTAVDISTRGKGVAAELVKMVVEDAIAKKMTVDPQCSYAAAMFDKNPEWMLFRKGRKI